MKNFCSYIFACFAFSCSSFVNASLEVSFIDVRQGNCTLVHCLENNAQVPMLIVDCGSGDCDYDKDREEFKERQLNLIIQLMRTSISVNKNNSVIVIISHPDLDHYNWMSDLCALCEKNNMVIRALYLGGKRSSYKLKSFISLITALEQKQIPIYSEKFTKANETVFEKQPYCYSLLPVLKSDDKNSASLVMRISCGTRSCLLTGDATEKTTDHIMQYAPESLKANILQASHHGAADSNGIKLIESVSPRYVVISSGISSYNHPDSSAVKRYLESVDGDDTDFHPVCIGVKGSRSTKLACCASSKDYGVIVTNKRVYGTGCSGSISFLLKSDQAVMRPRVSAWLKNFSDKKEALLNAVFYMDEFWIGDLKILNIKDLGLNDAVESDRLWIEHVIKAYDISSLKEVYMNGNTLNHPDTIALLLALVKKNKQIRVFALPDNNWDPEVKEEFVQAWNNRGLAVGQENFL